MSEKSPSDIWLVAYKSTFLSQAHFIFILIIGDCFCTFSPYFLFTFLSRVKLTPLYLSPQHLKGVRVNHFILFQSIFWVGVKGTPPKKKFLHNFLFWGQELSIFFIYSRKLQRVNECLWNLYNIFVLFFRGWESFFSVCLAT